MTNNLSSYRVAPGGLFIAPASKINVSGVTWKVSQDPESATIRHSLYIYITRSERLEILFILSNPHGQHFLHSEWIDIHPLHRHPYYHRVGNRYAARKIRRFIIQRLMEKNLHALQLPTVENPVLSLFYKTYR